VVSRPIANGLSAMIYEQDPLNPDNLIPINHNNLGNYNWYVNAPQTQQVRLAAIAADPRSDYSVDNALDLARNTVVAAVDGTGPGEIDFLIAAYRLRDNLQAFDPVLQVNIVTNVLNQRGFPPGTVTLVAGSVTAFGNQVPETELLIPHPGPSWARLGPPGGLASCIASVLGANSVAYVLTDNDVQNDSQSADLATRLQNVNTANANVQGYTALTWTIVQPTITEQLIGQETVRFTRLGGAFMRIRHLPPYRLVTVQRQ
jgi:hypothetical protein